jgi:hypothetical protein
MPPFLVPILAAVTAALPIVLGGIALLAPVLLPLWYRAMKPAERKQLVGHIKGAADLVAAVAKATPMTWDDQVAAILRIAADEGAKIDKQPELARSIAESLVAKNGGDGVVPSHVAIAKVQKAVASAGASK